MTDIEREELKTLNYCIEYVRDRGLKQILVLTAKSLSLKLEEKDRLPILGGINELQNFLSGLQERQKHLATLQNKEKENE